MRSVVIRFMLVCLAYGIAPAYAAEPYFSEQTISPTLLTPPLVVRSEQWNAEIDVIINEQKNAAAAELAKAAEERNVNPEMMTQAIDPTLTRENYPALYHMMDRVSATSYKVGQAAKNHWRTSRPYIMDTRVKALINAHNNPAYPSGHTSSSYSWAYALSQVMPDKHTAFIQRAEEIAQHRVLVGMHYPHDIRGGKELALLIIGGLLQNAEFQADCYKARAEELKGRHVSSSRRQTSSELAITSFTKHRR